MSSSLRRHIPFIKLRRGEEKNTTELRNNAIGFQGGASNNLNKNSVVRAQMRVWKKGILRLRELHIIQSIAEEQRFRKPLLFLIFVYEYRPSTSLPQRIANVNKSVSSEKNYSQKPHNSGTHIYMVRQVL